MSLGKRCDEIVRLIDETLADLGLDTTPAAAIEMVPAPRRSRPTRAGAPDLSR